MLCVNRFYIRRHRENESLKCCSPRRRYENRAERTLQISLCTKATQRDLKLQRPPYKHCVGQRLLSDRVPVILALRAPMHVIRIICLAQVSEANNAVSGPRQHVLEDDASCNRTFCTTWTNATYSDFLIICRRNSRQPPHEVLELSLELIVVHDSMNDLRVGAAMACNISRRAEHGAIEEDVDMHVIVDLCEHRRLESTRASEHFPLSIWLPAEPKSIVVNGHDANPPHAAVHLL